MVLDHARKLLPLRTSIELVPAGSIAARALATVVAIMTFLAVLTGGGAVLVQEASIEWASTATREITIQVKPAPGRDAEAEARNMRRVVEKVPGVAQVQVLTRKESGALLDPWLGSGLDLADLPIPVLVIVRLTDRGSAQVAEIRQAATGASAGAIVDDHRTWARTIRAMADGLVVLALIILALVLSAMGLAVVFATRGAMASSREIIDVLHFVGASDDFIANEFQRRFLHLGFRGAVIGGTFALLTFFAAGSLMMFGSTALTKDQAYSLFGDFSLGVSGYAVVGAIVGMMALLTGLISRSVVYRHLKQLR